MTLEWYTTTERPQREIDLIKFDLLKAMHLPGWPTKHQKNIKIEDVPSQERKPEHGRDKTA